MWLRVLSKDKMHIKKVPLGGTAYVMNWGESNYAIYKSYWYPFPSAVVDNERDAKRIMRAIFDGQEYIEL